MLPTSEILKSQRSTETCFLYVDLRRYGTSKSAFQPEENNLTLAAKLYNRELLRRRDSGLSSKTYIFSSCIEARV